MRPAHRTLAIAILVVAATVAILWAASAWSIASRAAEESAQRALLAEAAQLLETHHARHGQYPDSLGELPLTYPDGGDAETLASLQYNTDGDHYVILVQGAASGAQLKECR